MTWLLCAGREELLLSSFRNNEGWLVVGGVLTGFTGEAVKLMVKYIKIPFREARNGFRGLVYVVCWRSRALS